MMLLVWSGLLVILVSGASLDWTHVAILVTGIGLGLALAEIR